MRRALWHFDFVSPYAYLQFRQLDRLPDDVALVFRPVLFAGILAHWKQLGPAEIPGKKASTFLLTRWRAQKRGVPFRAPPRMPFNPLTLLRLAIALGGGRDIVATIFDHVWAEGRDGQAPESIAALAEKLGVDDVPALIDDPAVKATLRANTEAAIAAGVFGVPSFEIDGHVFWGDDMFELMLEWLDDPALLDDAETRRIMTLAPAAERRRTE